MSSLSSGFSDSFQSRFAKSEEYPILEYLDRCKDDHMLYASATERMLAAIGEPHIIDTSEDGRLSRIFSNRKIRVYDAFSDMYGAEDALDRLVAYFRNAAEHLEESRGVCYLKGPVGGGKSSVVERLKELMEKYPIYVLTDPSEHDPDLRLSPVFESPLGLFNVHDHGAELDKVYGIDSRYLCSVPSGWAQMKLREFNGDWKRFTVTRVYPDRHAQIGVMKIEPGDDNTQDISVLVGKTDIRKLDKFPQNHPYSYSYSGGLNRTTQGMLEFAEMFKANIKTLNPLLTATQEHNYNGTENIPSLPYNGFVVAHSNLSEWAKFRNDKTNEAFIDRVYIVDVPYCLRTDEEEKIYEKMLRHSGLNGAPIAPRTLNLLSQFMVLTRLQEPKASTVYCKMKVYNGENVKDTMPLAKPIDEYHDAATVDEGLDGMSTRFGFKTISQTFNLRPGQLQANPVDLIYVLENALRQEHLPDETYARYTNFVKEWLYPRYFEYIDKELRIAYLESYSDYGQNILDQYFMLAEAWLDDMSVRDPETHVILNREKLEAKLDAIEKPAKVINVKDFRNDIVHYILRYKASHKGATPAWTDYEKLKTVIAHKMFATTSEIMPVISFGRKSTAEEEKKHNEFVKRMKKNGYTEEQVRLLVEWWSSNREK